MEIQDYIVLFAIEFALFYVAYIFQQKDEETLSIILFLGAVFVFLVFPLNTEIKTITLSPIPKSNNECYLYSKDDSFQYMDGDELKTLDIDKSVDFKILYHAQNELEESSSSHAYAEIEYSKSLLDTIINKDGGCINKITVHTLNDEA